jgi:hypothetical protein
MPRKHASKRGHPKPKTVLRLPDLDHAKSAVLNSRSSVDAQQGYRHAIDEFVERSPRSRSGFSGRLASINIARRHQQERFIH